MNKLIKQTLILCVLVLQNVQAQAQEGNLKVAVIGGLDMAGVWPRLERLAEQQLELNIETILAAPKERILPVFQNGQADLLLIHGGDESFALEALGYAAPSSVWAYSEFVIAGPAEDPAGLMKLNSGRQAVLALASSGQAVINFRDTGSFGVLRRLLDAAGLSPRDLNLIPDNAERPQQILRQADNDNAYVIVGRMPLAFGRMPAEKVKLLLSGDPSMRRAYVVVTPGPLHPAGEEARANAMRLANFLTSDDIQRTFGAAANDELRWIFPKGDAAALINQIE